MELLTSIPVRKTLHSRINEVDFKDLEFGKWVSDHMLVCDYADEEWQQPQVVPFANLSLNPSSLALHYGQTVFEGMKAFRMIDGKTNIFRIEKHYHRFAKSLERMCMAVPPKDIFVDGLIALVKTDKAWVPDQDGASLYLRPFVYASEARFGVKVSGQYRFVIFTGPVTDIYKKPLKVKVETDFIRAAKGGTGYSKCGGNYGAAFYPTMLARKEGYDQVIWTNGQENLQIEESGAMNLMFVIDGVLVTPPLTDTIVHGITRDSMINIAKDLGWEVVERPVPASDLIQAFREKKITEAFGTGTAVVVAPIETIGIRGVDYHLPKYNEESKLNILKKRLEDIRVGRSEDVYGWNTVI